MVNFIAFYFIAAKGEREVPKAEKSVFVE